MAIIFELVMLLRISLRTSAFSFSHMMALTPDGHPTGLQAVLEGVQAQEVLRRQQQRRLRATGPAPKGLAVGSLGLGHQQPLPFGWYRGGRGGPPGLTCGRCVWAQHGPRSAPKVHQTSTAEAESPPRRAPHGSTRTRADTSATWILPGGQKGLETLNVFRTLRCNCAWKRQPAPGPN